MPDARGSLAVVAKSRAIAPSLSAGQWIVNCGLVGEETTIRVFEPDDKGICERRWYKTATTLAEDSAPSAPSSAS